MSRTVKPKGSTNVTGYNQGGRLSRVPKPAPRTGKTSGKGFPGAK